jgi:hypothetical protein
MTGWTQPIVVGRHAHGDQVNIEVYSCLTLFSILPRTLFPRFPENLKWTSFRILERSQTNNTTLSPRSKDQELDWQCTTPMRYLLLVMWLIWCVVYQWVCPQLLPTCPSKEMATVHEHQKYRAQEVRWKVQRYFRGGLSKVLRTQLRL